MFCRKQAIGRWYIFPPHLVSVSTLPCKTKNKEIINRKIKEIARKRFMAISGTLRHTEQCTTSCVKSEQGKVEKPYIKGDHRQ